MFVYTTDNYTVALLVKTSFYIGKVVPILLRRVRLSDDHRLLVIKYIVLTVLLFIVVYPILLLNLWTLIGQKETRLKHFQVFL